MEQSLNQIMEGLPLTPHNRDHPMGNGNEVTMTGGEAISQEMVGSHSEFITTTNASHINMMTTGHQETTQTTGGQQWIRGGLL